MINAFDKRGQPLGAIDFIETQWNRKWSSCGTFTVYMATKDYNPAIKYIQNTGRPETGIVQKVQLEQKKEGKFTTLTGFFLNKMADMGAYPRAWNFSESTVKAELTAYMNAVFSHISGGARVLPYAGLENLYNYTLNDGSEYPASLEGGFDAGAAGEQLYGALSNTGYSFDALPIFAPASVNENTTPIIGIDFRFKRSRDLTSKVFFGDAYGNVSSINYTLDESAEKAGYMVTLKVDSLTGWAAKGFKTFTEVVDGETVNKIMLVCAFNENRPSDIGKAYPLEVIEANISDIELTTDNATKIAELMRKAARLEMLNNYKIETIEVSVLQERFKYLQDYDLGDRCSIYLEDLQKHYSAPIEEVREVHAKNKVDIEIVLGTPTARTWRKLI